MKVVTYRPCLKTMTCPYGDFIRHMYPNPKFNTEVCVLNADYCCPVIVWGDDDPTIIEEDGEIRVCWKEESDSVSFERILQDIKDVKESDIENRICSNKLLKDFSEFIKTEEGNKIKEQAWKELKEDGVDRNEKYSDIMDMIKK